MPILHGVIFVLSLFIHWIRHPKNNRSTVSLDIFINGMWRLCRVKANFATRSHPSRSTWTFGSTMPSGDGIRGWVDTRIRRRVKLVVFISYFHFDGTYTIHIQYQGTCLKFSNCPSTTTQILLSINDGLVVVVVLRSTEPFIKAMFIFPIGSGVSVVSSDLNL